MLIKLISAAIFLGFMALAFIGIVKACQWLLSGTAQKNFPSPRPNSPSADDNLSFDERQRLRAVSDRHFSTYLALYNEAESLRKKGMGVEATPVYEHAIAEIEPTRGEVPPAPFRQFSKMLYHMGEDERAVQVLDRYAQMQRDRAREPKSTLRELRGRLASGDFRRLKNKYE